MATRLCSVYCQNRLTSEMSITSSSSVSDIEIFWRNHDWHHKYSRKKIGKDNYNDKGELNQQNSSSWTILCNERYTWLAAHYSTIISDEKLANECLSPQRNVRNQNIMSDKDLIENRFGILCNFTLSSSKWRWGKHRYFIFLLFGVALTNAHVMWNSLHSFDRTFLHSIQNRLCFISD